MGFFLANHKNILYKNPCVVAVKGPYLGGDEAMFVQYISSAIVNVFESIRA